ncbi:EF-hand domain-containing protein [Lysobacter humi (ex Lee et al. 2017)]
MTAALPGAAGLFLAAAALAAPPVTSSGDYFARLDTDGDRRVSLAEFQAWMGYAFERMDVDRDGIIATHELPGGRGTAVSLDEHRRRLAATFAKQDRDRSGFLDPRELAAPPQR